MIDNPIKPPPDNTLLKKVSWAKKLPQPVKNILLKHFWSAKGFWEDVQDYISEMVGNVPWHAYRLWWYKHICGVKIGTHTSIHRHCRFFQPHKVKIGNHCVINYGVLLDGRSGIEIGENVSISEGTVILTLSHDMDDPDFGLTGGPVIIEDYVFIGSYARVLPNVRIGHGAVVAAGAVVTRDVKPFTVVGGIPARFIRDRATNLHFQLDFRKRFG